MYLMVVDISKGLNIKNNYQLLCANCNWIKRYENNEGNFEDWNEYMKSISYKNPK